MKGIALLSPYPTLASWGRPLLVSMVRLCAHSGLSLSRLTPTSLHQAPDAIAVLKVYGPHEPP